MKLRQLRLRSSSVTLQSNFFLFFFICILINNEKMLGRWIVALIFPFIAYLTIYPILTQEVNNAIMCNSSNYTGNESLFTYLGKENPIGKTGGFGGAGWNNHFGGYDGAVTHKEFIQPVYYTNSSLLNPGCVELTENQKYLFTQIPMIFMIGLFLIGLFWVKNMYWRYNCF